MNKLEIQAGIQVVKPVEEVFDAIVNNDKMKNYFISKASGPLKNEGEIITWHFPEVADGFPIRTGKVEPYSYISYYWNDVDGEETFVEMKLEEVKPGLTYIRITEKNKDNNEAGIGWLKRNTEGWANFLACLKAWLEYGINLRKDAFNPSQLPS